MAYPTPTYESLTVLTRPTFNGATPWDSGNFNPTGYAPLNAIASIGGAWTFSTIPQVPTAPTNDVSTNAANTTWVNEAIQSGFLTPFTIDQPYLGVNPPTKLTANQIVFNSVCARGDYLVPSYAQVSALVHPTANAVFTVTLAGTSIGTFTIAPGGGVTWNLTGEDAIALTRTIGQQVLITAPATPDTTLAGVGITMPGVATGSIYG